MILPRQPTALIPTFLSVLALSTPISAPYYLGTSYYIDPSLYSYLILRQYSIHHQLTPFQYCNSSPSFTGQMLRRKDRVEPLQNRQREMRLHQSSEERKRQTLGNNQGGRERSH